MCVFLFAAARNGNHEGRQASIGQDGVAGHVAKVDPVDREIVLDKGRACGDALGGHDANRQQAAAAANRLGGGGTRIRRRHGKGTIEQPRARTTIKDLFDVVDANGEFSRPDAPRQDDPIRSGGSSSSSARFAFVFVPKYGPCDLAFGLPPDLAHVLDRPVQSGPFLMLLWRWRRGRSCRSHPFASLQSSSFLGVLYCRWPMMLFLQMLCGQGYEYIIEAWVFG